MAFCSECGNELNDKAIVCTHCGIAIEGRPTLNNQRSKWFLSIPITGIVLGTFGLLTFLDDSYWDVETIWGCIMLWSVPPIILGTISINKNIHKVMSIISLVLGSASLVGFIAILSTL